MPIPEIIILLSNARYSTNAVQFTVIIDGAKFDKLIQLRETYSISDLEQALRIGSRAMVEAVRDMEAHGVNEHINKLIESGL